MIPIIIGITFRTIFPAEKFCWTVILSVLFRIRNIASNMNLPITGRQDSHPLDSSRSHHIQEVHLGQRRVELWHSHVGSDVIWWTAILGHEQPRCKWHCFTNLINYESLSCLQRWCSHGMLCKVLMLGFIMLLCAMPSYTNQLNAVIQQDQPLISSPLFPRW